MNSRARELARRVVGKRKEDVGSVSLFDEQIDSFADLLIRECMWQIIKDPVVPAEIQMLLGERFRQHFWD